jgi:hypothetical protein
MIGVCAEGEALDIAGAQTDEALAVLELQLEPFSNSSSS